MLDKYDRKISYLRVSVTDRCNLRCTYCMPVGGVKLLSHKDILTFDEIKEVISQSVDLGIDKIKLTGGEPLVRKEIVGLVGMIAAISGIKDFGMTTNGILLKDFAADLKKSGLHRINVSLDTVDPQKYKKITRGGNLKKVFEGIVEAKRIGLYPIKINCVIEKSSGEPDALMVKKFCVDNGLEVRFIHKMDLEKGEFSIVEGGQGGNCSICNRIRLNSVGDISPCLFGNQRFNIRKIGVKKALAEAIGNKPACGVFSSINKFHNIGG